MNTAFVGLIFQNHTYALIITIQTVPQVSFFIMKTCAERFEMWKIEVSKPWGKNIFIQINRLKKRITMQSNLFNSYY